MDEILPELEVGVDHSVGETFTANTDTLKHTVTGQLVHYQVRVNETWRTKRNVQSLQFLKISWMLVFDGS